MLACVTVLLTSALLTLDAAIPWQASKRTMLFSPNESATGLASERRSQKDAQSDDTEDCLGCRLIGFATCLTISGFCFTEAYRLSPSRQMTGRMPPQQPSTSSPLPSARSQASPPSTGAKKLFPPTGSVRTRFVSLVVVGIGSASAGVYRLIM